MGAANGLAMRDASAIPATPDATIAAPPVLATGRSVVPLPRLRLGARLLSDENLERLEFLLDEMFRVPGTRIRFGIDGLIGLVPIAGDVLAGLLSLVIPLAAWIRGVPYVGIARMTVNLGIGVLIGSIPLAGDAFDIAWKVNRRNYRLLKRHLGQPRRHTWRDWVFLLLLTAMMGLVLAAPIVLVVWLWLWLAHR
jgi:Domain of unknown function (DUF4112)